MSSPWYVVTVKCHSTRTVTGILDWISHIDFWKICIFQSCKLRISWNLCSKNPYVKALVSGLTGNKYGLGLAKALPK